MCKFAEANPATKGLRASKVKSALKLILVVGYSEWIDTRE